MLSYDKYQKLRAGFSIDQIMSKSYLYSFNFQIFFESSVL
jgi:hypothetical protein